MACAKKYSIDSTSSWSECSDFYIACRNGDTKTVKQLLVTLSLEELNREEPNGSTALHAASYYGHFDIVRLLLNAGASRSIKNKFECCPYDEGKTPEIRGLFFRGKCDRYGDDVSTQLEWLKVNTTSSIYRKAIYRRLWLKSAWNETKMLNRIDWMIENYLTERLSNATERSMIQFFFTKTKLTKDPIWLVKAYTAETEYYRKLNRDFASEDFTKNWEASMEQWIVAALYNHPALEQFSFKGETYRGAKMNDFDISQYKVGTHVMNKSFLSTSKEQKIAENFAIGGDSSKYSVLCKYETRNERTALAIETMSEFPGEKEVLILPYAAFKVINVIKYDKSKAKEKFSLDYEFHLRECKSMPKEMGQKLKFLFTNAHQSAMLDDFELSQQLESFSF
ncbi:unnamed protein product [Didymodactylos carnosus]|uniref:NAD(P)(+)--arginine ADP-ribosyltransferase n=1 Tax=Didymodactylos carnosus TaxID=1234261 RepID=A0A814H964_9BILA|nr:unnamed protein product [Didymodactylos carnosus]CAF1483749.1 unnamed protein product [Didymodactylos carnosus]CAF3778785.1 unnamed protein product [Didymodactylos carnosus]CAF4273902.1 unnamed protein product [Didymodactylos carnosus]